MSSETRVISSTGGRKGQKMERHDLIPVGQIRELALHYGAGAEKYTERDADGKVTHDGANNWQLGYDWSLSYAAAQRHLTAFWAGEDLDSEFGSKHLIAAAWHCFTMAWFMDYRPDFDDRLKDPILSVLSSFRAQKFNWGGTVK